MTQARREGENARQERERETEARGVTTVWVVAQNTMMGLYYPSVLSVSVYLHIFSPPPPCKRPPYLLAEAAGSAVHKSACERSGAVIEHEMLINC